MEKSSELNMQLHIANSHMMYSAPPLKLTAEGCVGVPLDIQVGQIDRVKLSLHSRW